MLVEGRVGDPGAYHGTGAGAEEAWLAPAAGADCAAASASRSPSVIWARLAPHGTTTRPGSLLTRSSSRQHLVITGTGPDGSPLPGGPEPGRSALSASLRGHMSTIATSPP